MSTPTPDKAPQPIPPPEPVEQWVRFRRIGDRLTIWDVGFHPTLGHDLLFDGAAGDPSVSGILNNLRILAEPVPPPKRALQLLDELEARTMPNPTSPVGRIIGELRSIVEADLMPGNIPHCDDIEVTATVEIDTPTAEPIRSLSMSFSDVMIEFARDSGDAEKRERAMKALSRYLTDVVTEYIHPNETPWKPDATVTITLPLLCSMMEGIGTGADARGLTLRWVCDHFQKIKMAKANNINSAALKGWPTLAEARLPEVKLEKSAFRVDPHGMGPQVHPALRLNSGDLQALNQTLRRLLLSDEPTDIEGGLRCLQDHINMTIREHISPHDRELGPQLLLKIPLLGSMMPDLTAIYDIRQVALQRTCDIFRRIEAITFGMRNDPPPVPKQGS